MVAPQRRPTPKAYAAAVRDAERARHMAHRVRRLAIPLPPTLRKLTEAAVLLQSEKAHYDLALAMVKGRDDRLTMDFSWLPPAVVGNRPRGPPHTNPPPLAAVSSAVAPPRNGERNEL